MGQHMEYAGNVTQESDEQNNAITTCIYGWWRLYGYMVFAKSQFFPTTKEYILFNYHGGC